MFLNASQARGQPKSTSKSSARLIEKWNLLCILERTEDTESVWLVLDASSAENRVIVCSISESVCSSSEMMLIRVATPVCIPITSLFSSSHIRKQLRDFTSQLGRPGTMLLLRMRVLTAVLGLEEISIGVDGGKLFGDLSVRISQGLQIIPSEGMVGHELSDSLSNLGTFFNKDIGSGHISHWEGRMAGEIALCQGWRGNVCPG